MLKLQKKILSVEEIWDIYIKANPERSEESVACLSTPLWRLDGTRRNGHVGQVLRDLGYTAHDFMY